MSVEGLIKAIFANYFVVVLFVIAAIVTLVKSRRTSSGLASLFWAELLFYLAGIGMIYSGFFHAYFQAMTARDIGWQPSPFQYELGWFEIGLGCVGVMCLWRNYEFRLAVTLPYAIFLFAAAAQHIDEMLRQHNYSPNNAGVLLWFGDIFVPLLTLALAFAARGPTGARGRVNVERSPA